MDLLSCDPAGAPTVPLAPLGLLLWRSTLCGRFDARGLLIEYARREVNALLWLALISITALLLRRIADLARLWWLGCWAPGQPLVDLRGEATQTVDRWGFMDKHGSNGFFFHLRSLDYVPGFLSLLWDSGSYFTQSCSCDTCLANILTKEYQAILLPGPENN